MQEILSHLEKLSRICLLPEEQDEFSKQIPDILQYFQKIEEIPGLEKNLENKNCVHFWEDCRIDVTKESLTETEVFQNTSVHEHSFFVVPKILDL